MTKICMLSIGHSHIDDRIYYKEVLSLTKKYSNIYVVAPNDVPPDHQFDNPEVTFISLIKTGSFLKRFLIIADAIRTVTKLQPHICHFHDYELIFALPFLRLFTKSKIIYDVHEVYPEMVEESERIPERFRLYISKIVDVFEKNLSRLAHFIITTDENISDRFRGVNKNVSTIFNYPRKSIFHIDEDRINQLNKLYHGRTPIIYTGGIDENKGVFQMIKAVQILNKIRPDIILLLIGSISNSLKAKVEKEINARDIASQVKLMGFVPHVDIVNYIHISKVGLIVNLPTKKWHKNIPIKQFEYMACGVPVLGSDLPPISSYVNKAKCGKVFDSTSEEALASGVLTILQDESEWQRMSEAGRKAVEELWNWDAMEEKLFYVYDKLLQS